MSRHPNTLCRTLAGKVIALSNCIASGNAEWRDRHESDISVLISEFMPSGSGIDCGTKIDLDACPRVDGAKLFFTFSFHHMNEGGMYDGWTEHVLIVTPSLWHDFDLRITGRDFLLIVMLGAALGFIVWSTERAHVTLARAIETRCGPALIF